MKPSQSVKRKLFGERGLWLELAALAGLIFLYWAIFARGYFSGQSVMTGDTANDIDLPSILLFSWKTFQSIPWWNPTVCNGFPYYIFLSVHYCYLSIFMAPSLLLFKLLNGLFGVKIITYVVFQTTIYLYIVNLLAIYLIARELVENKIAAFLTALIFTFSYLPIFNVTQMEFSGMAPSLFYIYGLVRFCNRRRALDLAWLVFFFAALAASIGRMFLESGVFWVAIFTAGLLLIEPGLLGSAVSIVAGKLKTRAGRLAVAGALLVLAAGLAVPLASYLANAGRIYRYREGPFDFAANTTLGSHSFPIETSQIWSVIFNWLPFGDINDRALMFAGGGHDYRYIGLASIPLMLSALLLGFESAYVCVLALTYFLANAFVIYTTNNLAYQFLIDHVRIIGDMRNMRTLMPRAGPPLFLVLLAGVGFDRLLRAGDRSEETALKTTLARFLTWLAAAGLLLFAAVPEIAATHGDFLHTAAHCGIYLAIFSGLCLLLLLAGDGRARRAACACLLIFTFTDMVISMSSHLGRLMPGPEWNFEGRAPIAALSNEIKGSAPAMGIWKATPLEPADLIPTAYFQRGRHSHSIFAGYGEWLVLATHDAGRKILRQWEPATGSVLDYPHFEFFSNGYFLPLETIRGDIEKSRALLAKEPPLFLHDKDLVARLASAPKKLKGAYQVMRFDFNSVEIQTKTTQGGFLYFTDNYDPYWSARLDGKRVPVYRANFTFKGVELPAGTHSVSWTYYPPARIAFQAHYALSALAFLILLGCEIRLLRRSN